MKIFLLLLSLAFFAAAGYGLAKGTIHCKGRTYSRAEQPLGFWASVAVFVAFGAMLVYFGSKLPTISQAVNVDISTGA